MSTFGTLTTKSLGFSMPAHAPLYPPPPYVYDDARLLYYMYPTDPARAAAVVPSNLEIANPPIATLAFASYPRSTLGQYLEVVQLIDVLFEGKPCKFAVALYVTNDAAMASGRELGGYPKKLASITIREEGPIGIARIDRPSGITLAEGVFRPGAPIPAPEPFPITHAYLCLRIVPSPENGKPPSLCELVRSHWTLESGTFWSASGSLRLASASVFDPLDCLPMLAPPMVMLYNGRITVAAESPPARFPIP